MLQLVSLLLLADSTLFLATLTGYYRAESCISSTISQSMSAVSSVTCRLLYVCFRRRQPSTITDWSFHLVVAVDSVILHEHSFNQYNLRSRLLNRTNLLTDKSFIIRMLYKTVICFFVQWLVLYTVLRFVKGFLFFFIKRIFEYMIRFQTRRRSSTWRRSCWSALVMSPCSSVLSTRTHWASTTSSRGLVQATTWHVSSSRRPLSTGHDWPSLQSRDATPDRSSATRSTASEPCRQQQLSSSSSVSTSVIRPLLSLRSL